MAKMAFLVTEGGRRKVRQSYQFFSYCEHLIGFNLYNFLFAFYGNPATLTWFFLQILIDLDNPDFDDEIMMYDNEIDQTDDIDYDGLPYGLERADFYPNDPTYQRDPIDDWLLKLAKKYPEVISQEVLDNINALSYQKVSG